VKLHRDRKNSGLELVSTAFVAPAVRSVSDYLCRLPSAPGSRLCIKPFPAVEMSQAAEAGRA